MDISPPFTTRSLRITTALPLAVHVAMPTVLPRVLAAVAIASAMALPSSIVDLASLDPDGAAIPLAGVGIWLLSILGLLVTVLAAGQAAGSRSLSRP